MASSSSSSGEFGVNGIHIAAFLGDLPLFKRLADEYQRLGPKIESIRDEDDHTVLHCAAAGGRTQVCEYIVEELKLDIDVKDMDDLTPLHTAILRGQFLTAVYLIENGADLNAATCLQRTPVHYAARFGPEELLKLLIMKGADVNAVSDIGTPLVDAAYWGKKDFVRTLLDNNADPNAISYCLTSPLLASIETRSIECVKLLLKAGADPNLSGSKVLIPLVVAARREDEEIIKCLLNAGADPNVTNNSGMTPIEVAASRSFLEGVKILFPVTSSIPAIPDWSIAGLNKHVCSNKAKEERKRKFEEHILLSKSKGLEAFNGKDYYGAIKWYSEVYHSNNDAKMLSNRSLCWICLNEGGLALQEAENCIKQRPDWPKAHYRKGAAMMLLKDYKRAMDAFSVGLKLAPKNKELEHALREAVEAKLKEQHLSGK
ncbi:hypothetical protein SLA2020_163840 [Shorea laevis]